MIKLVKFDIEDANKIHHIYIFTEKQVKKAKMRAVMKPDKWQDAHYF